MSHTPTASLPPRLQSSLRRLQARWWWLTFCHGSAKLVLAVIGMVGCGVTLDLLLPMGPWLRTTVLVGLCGAAAACASRFVIHRLRTGITAAELAALVETSHPEFEERLTTGVDLAGQADSVGPAAEAIRRWLLDEATQLTSSVQPERVIRYQPAAILLAWAALATTLLLGPAAIPGSGHGLLLTRLFVPWGNLQRSVLFDVELADDQTQSGELVVARGADLGITVLVRPTGSTPAGAHIVPAETWCHWVTASGQVDRRLMERRVAAPDASVDPGASPPGSRFTTSWPDVLEDFSFYVEADGSQSKRYDVRVVDPPELTGLTLQITPPEYTGTRKRTTEAVVGDVTVTEGSQLAWRLRFSKPVRSASLARLSTGSRTPDPGTHVAVGPAGPNEWTTTVSDDGRSARVEMVASAGGTLIVRMVDHDGLARDDQTYRRLVVQADQPPTLALSGQDRPTAVRPKDAVVIRAEASDDFGIDHLELELQVTPTTQDVSSVPRDRMGSRQLVHHFTIDLSKYSLTDGDRLVYRVRAADRRQRPGPNETWSVPRVLLIDKNARPPELADVMKRQDDIRARLQAAQQATRATRTLLTTTRQAVLQSLKDQVPFAGAPDIRKSGADLRDLAANVDAISRELNAHPLWRPLVGPARRISREILPEATSRIEPTLEASLADKSARLAQIDDLLAQALSAFDRLLASFDQLAALERDLLDLDRIAIRTARLADEVDALAALAGDGNEGETDIERKQREGDFDRQKTELTAQHDSLENALGTLLDKRPEVLEAARQAALARLTELGLKARVLGQREQAQAGDLDGDPETPPPLGAPAQTSAPPTQSPLIRQKEVARDATAQALEVASQLGTTADAARLAAAGARTAALAASRLSSGEVRNAVDASGKAARAATSAAESLEVATEAQPDPVLVRRARDLAERQQAIARHLALAVATPAGRRSIRIVAAQGNESATSQLTLALKQVAAQLALPPVELAGPASQARQARQKTSEALEAIAASIVAMRVSRPSDAVRNARTAAVRLEEAATLAIGGGDASQRPDTPVPSRVGEQVTSAADQLKQSRKNLDAAKFDSSESQSQRPGQKAGSQDGQGGGKGKKGKAKGKGKPGGKNGDGAGKSQQQQGQLAKSASQLRKAARTLKQASQKLKPGEQDRSSVAPPGPNDPNAKDTAGNAGTGSTMAMQLKALESELARLSGSAWGRLPGTLKTEILQATRRDPNGDYAKLIRFYFHEISRATQAPQPTPQPEPERP